MIDKIAYLQWKFDIVTMGNSTRVPIKFRILILTINIFNEVLKYLCLNMIYKSVELKKRLVKNRIVEYNDMYLSL